MLYDVLRLLSFNLRQTRLDKPMALIYRGKALRA